MENDPPRWFGTNGRGLPAEFAIARGEENLRGG